MKRHLLLFAIGAGVALGAGVTLAQKPDVKPNSAVKPAEKAAKRTGDVILKSQGGMHDDAKGIARLTGSVVVRQEGEEFILYADSVTYDRNTNRAVANGNLRVETKDSTITGLALRADFDTKHIIISGNVVMDSHGKNTGMKTTPKKGPCDALGDVSRKPSKMLCNTIDFNYDIQEALVTGNIRLTQGETKGTCRQIVFDEENNVAELKGDVIFTDKKGQTFQTDTLIVWFDSDKMDFRGPVTLKGKNQEEDTKPEPGKTPAPAQPKRNFGAPPEVPGLEKEPAETTPGSTPASDVKPKPAENRE